MHAWKEGKPATPRVAKWLTQQQVQDIRPTLWPSGTHEALLLFKRSYTSPVHAERFFGTADERNSYRAGLSSDYVAGECDWYTEDSPVVWVDDLKTGKEWTTPPSQVDQLRFYALVLSSLSGDKAALVSITHWPRYPLGTPPTRTIEVISAEELKAWSKHLIKPRLDVINPGPWCQYCKAICPANPKEDYRE